MFEARRRKKLAEAVLSHVQPLVTMVARYLDGDPAKLIADKYMLGFFSMTVALFQRQLSPKPLSTEDKETVSFIVFEQLFGPVAIHPKRFTDLLVNSTTNDDFKKGSDAAYKIQAVFSGSHQLQNDPDFLAACESVSNSGKIPNYFPHGATEALKIGSEMMRTLFYNRARDIFGQQKTD
jgi:hypothetical protein